MIIVSQNKKRISENIEIEIYPKYEEETKKIIGYIIENVFMELGEYTTEERAEEILHEIVYAYMSETSDKKVAYKMPEK